IQVLADEFDKKIEIVHAADDVDGEPVFEDAEEDLVERPPVVTIMGHVDHGKTSLLDAIRETEVAAGEAGGITQHIGAYQVHHGGREITFLDTPGHEAFTAMRARGARVTGLAVVVVAADEGGKPPTEEATDPTRAAAVIESKLDPGRGPVVTILIQRGTLRVGDALVAGAHFGRVRAMQDFTGNRLKRATPGQPVEMLGFDGVPEAGEIVRVVENER